MTKVRYQVRGRALVDLVRDFKMSVITLSPFFQRKLVWRDLHKVDFIKTILAGYPFPEIFIARGNIDVETMTATSCVVDGQQRMNAILEFVADKFAVDGRKFSELSTSKKEEFLKYEIAIIDLEIGQDDPQVIEIFKRLNRTFYSLSQIEKLSTEYASSYFMLTAKMLCGEMAPLSEGGDLFSPSKNVDPDLTRSDPNINEDFVEWANRQDISHIWSLILEAEIFSSYEISRQVHLMFVLNLMATFMSGFYARNEQITEHLENYKDPFDGNTSLVQRINNAANYLLTLDLEDKKFWFSKSNSFSLLAALDSRDAVVTRLNLSRIKGALDAFARDVPADYSLAAKEAVNNKKERLLRHEKICTIIDSAVTAE